MVDEQDRAEMLDDDAQPMVAPDKPPGAQAYGAAGAEPHAVESVARRAAREEPELWETRSPGSGAEEPPPDDDFATERAAPPPAEVAAMQVVGVEERPDDDPGEEPPVEERDVSDPGGDSDPDPAG